MTRSELLVDLARRLNKNTTLDSATQARLLNSINETHRWVLSMPGCQHLRHASRTFASVADQAEYGLPNLTRVRYIRELDNDRFLQPMTLAQYREIDPDPASVTGTPTHWIWVGYGPVASQPSNASSLFVDSTSASDTNTCYVEGMITGGYPRSVSVTMTGTTAVNISAAVSTWITVQKFYLSDAAVGVVTLHEDSDGGTELARIGIGQTQQRYYRLILYPTPSSAITYYMDTDPESNDLAQDDDSPLIPPEWHDLLIYGAMSREYEKTDDQRYQVAERRFRERLDQFKYFLAQNPSGSETFTRRGPMSRLGPWFPLGS